MPSDPEVAEVATFGPSGTRPIVLLEVPHGATRRADFDAVRERLRGPLPDDLEAFFHVNTDEGAPELARAVAERLAAEGIPCLLLRCLVPRTLIDVNRIVTGGIEAGMTAGLPGYVRDPHDRALLLRLHERYATRAEAAYASILAEPRAVALMVHTYAPRSIDVDVDGDIVRALRAAYRPARLRNWPERPEVDLITEAPDGTRLSPAPLTPLLRESLERSGRTVAENASYRLHPATSGHRLSRRWPGRILCLEVRRDLLGAPWRPFAESRIGPRKVARLARPIADAIRRAVNQAPEKKRLP